MVGRAVRAKVGEGLAELVGAEGSTFLDGGNSHESVDEIVRSDFALLSVEETVDLCSAGKQGCQKKEKLDEVHFPTLEFVDWCINAHLYQ